MSDDRDWSWLVGTRPDVPAAHAADVLLWRVTKDSRAATLHTRAHPLGIELRATIDRAPGVGNSPGSDIVWSRVFRTAAEVGAEAQEHLALWLARGWVLETSADSAPH